MICNIQDEYFQLQAHTCTLVKSLTFSICISYCFLSFAPAPALSCPNNSLPVISASSNRLPIFQHLSLAWHGILPDAWLLDVFFGRTSLFFFGHKFMKNCSLKKKKKRLLKGTILNGLNCILKTNLK